MKFHHPVLAIAILLLTACNPMQHNASQVPESKRHLEAISAKTLTVTRESAMAYEAVVGTVMPKMEARIASKLAGRVLEVDVELGSIVKQGDRLLRIDAEEIRAKLGQAVAQRDQAEKDLERYKGLLQKQAVAQREFDAVATQAAVAREAVAEAEAMLAYTIIEAPFDGVITAKMADVGDLAMPGAPLLVLANPNALRLNVNVPERVIEHIAVGQCLRVAVGQQQVKACIAEIAPTADPMSRTVLVKLDLPPNSEVLGIGRFCRVPMPIGEREAIRIPVSTIIRRGQLDMVFVAADGKAVMRLIRRGRQDGDLVTVLSGLEDGETIIANPPPMIADGQPLQ